MTANNDALNAYKPIFATWQVKVVGSKPTAEMLAKVHGLGLRPGKQAIACAMALRDEGVTGPQIVMVCGAPQLNRMRGLIGGGLFKRVVVPANEQGHTVYKCSVTPKGDAEIKRIAKVMANASTTTEAPKPKAAKVKATKADVANKVGTAAMQAAVSDPLMLPDSLRRKPAADQHV